MTAITVTPEIVRVFFLRRNGKSLRFSFGLSAAIISALVSVCLSLCLAAIWFLMRFRSLCVGEGKSSSVSMISRVAASFFTVCLPYMILAGL